MFTLQLLVNDGTNLSFLLENTALTTRDLSKVQLLV